MTWALHNPLKGWTLYDLQLEEVQAVINTLTPNEARLLKVSQKGQQTWEAFNQTTHALLLSNKKLSGEGYASLDQIEKSSTESTDFFIVKAKKIITPRLHERIECELEAIIDASFQVFKTKTVDVSEGGVNFKDVIPDWVSGYFIVTVFYQQKPYQVMCSMVEDQKIRHRVQVVSEDADSHYVNYKKMVQALKVSKS